MMSRHALGPVIASVVAAFAITAAAGMYSPLAAEDASPAGLRKDVIFTAYTPLSANREIIRRMLSPLAAAQIPAALARAGSQLSEQPVDLVQEKFVLYVPQHAPAKGYGLLVFVPPWDGAGMPTDWVPVLDQFGVILVAPLRSGNDQSVLGRRYPLAIAAEYNVAKRYRLDPDRVYVSGFSGGSRVALRLALAYPDVFRGAILNAGGDPIGEPGAPLPPRDLFLRFQEFSRLVFVTGDRDTGAGMADRASMRSLDNWCVFNVNSHAEPFLAHDLMTAGALTRALELLAVPASPDPAKLAACRTANETELSRQLAEAESLLTAGRRDDAHQKLMDIDEHFGGLAAPQSVTLFGRLGGK